MTNKLEVGDTLRHIHCKMKREVVFIGKGYLLVEGGQLPSIITDEQLDLYEKLEFVYNDITVKMLHDAWHTNRNEFYNFLKGLDRRIQDFKESSLP